MRHPARWLWEDHLDVVARGFKAVPPVLRPVKDWLNEGARRYGFSGAVSCEVWLVRSFEVYELAASAQEADDSWRDVLVGPDGDLVDGETRHYVRRDCVDYVPIRLCEGPFREDGGRSEFFYVGYPFTRHNGPDLAWALANAADRIRGRHMEKPYRAWIEHRPEGKDDTPRSMYEADDHDDMARDARIALLPLPKE